MPYPPKAASGSSRHLRYPLLVSAISLSLANLLPASVKAATIDVVVSGPCTLIEAINEANVTGTSGGNCSSGDTTGTDTLVLANSSMHSFTAANNAIDGSNALPSITSVITIQGNGATIQRASGSATNFRLFHVEAGGNLTLDHVTLSGGVASAGAYGSDGGALLNRGTVTLNNSTVTGNSANSGGGLWNDSGKVTLSDSTVSGNSASVGGGLYNYSVSVTLSNSTMSGNSAANKGGGLYNYSGSVTLNSSTVSGNSAANLGGGGGMRNSSSTVTLSNSTVSGNSAQFGGGLLNQSCTVTLSNSTVSGNTVAINGGGFSNSSSSVTLSNSTVSGNSAASRGGGFYNTMGTVTLNNSTVSGNSATNLGGGLYNRSSSVITLSKSIVANSPGGGDCFNNSITFNGADHNWFEDNKCDGTADGDPNLGPLANNGGPTQTHALLAGSGAINAAGECGLATDQRGQPRSVCKCDIGAYEVPEANPDNESCKTSFFVIPLKNGKSAIFGL